MRAETATEKACAEGNPQTNDAPERGMFCCVYPQFNMHSILLCAPHTVEHMKHRDRLSTCVRRCMGECMCTTSRYIKQSSMTICTSNCVVCVTDNGARKHDVGRTANTGLREEGTARRGSRTADDVAAAPLLGGADRQQHALVCERACVHLCVHVCVCTCVRSMCVCVHECGRLVELGFLGFGKKVQHGGGHALPMRCWRPPRCREGWARQQHIHACAVCVCAYMSAVG